MDDFDDHYDIPDLEGDLGEVEHFQTSALEEQWEALNKSCAEEIAEFEAWLDTFETKFNEVFGK